MVNTVLFMEQLQECGYRKVVSVPCSFLSNPINYAVNQGIYMPVCNEGDAIAVSAGMTLAGEKNVVFMQNSGLANSVSPLSSLNFIFDIPCLMFVGFRGSDADEPQHELMGGFTQDLLDGLHIKHVVLSKETDVAIAQLKEADAYIEKEKKSICILIARGTFEAVSISKDPQVQSLPLRADLLAQLASARDENTIVITTTGYTSRELYQIGDHPQNFYMVGSMGCASSIGLGMAQARPDQKIIVVDGDGALLMRASALPVLAAERPSNLLYIVLANDSYESTGGQPLPEQALPIPDLLRLVYGDECIIAEDNGSFEAAISGFISQPAFRCVYSRIQSKALEPLGRPKESMRHIRQRFSSAIGKQE